MNLQLRDFLFVVTLAAAAATPAWAQGTPDFSGTWAHPYLTGFEPPA